MYHTHTIHAACMNGYMYHTHTIHAACMNGYMYHTHTIHAACMNGYMYLTSPVPSSAINSGHTSKGGLAHHTTLTGSNCARGSHIERKLLCVYLILLLLVMNKVQNLAKRKGH